MRRVIFVLVLMLMIFLMRGEAANITVTTAADGEAGSLRWAINAANLSSENDTIYLPAGTYHLTGKGLEDENLTGDLDINTNGSITIIGDGETVTMIDGGQLDRVLDIHSGTVFINGVTIQNGKLNCTFQVDEYGYPYSEIEHGGGIRNNGNLTMRNCTIQNNAAKEGCYIPFPGKTAEHTRGGSGGGVYNENILVMRDCTISYNTAGRGTSIFDSEPAGNGGGICNKGEMTLTDCVINHNTIGVTAWSGGNGGGIYSQGSMTLTRCNIEDNATGDGFDGLGGNYPGKNGGNGGGIYQLKEDANLYYCTIRDNSTGSGGYGDTGGSAGKGGGIYNGYNNLNLFNCAVINNKTGDGGAAESFEPGHGGHGGGLHQQEYGALVLLNCTVSGNTTGCGTNSNNSPSDDGHGGGIHCEGELQLTHCTVADNRTGVSVNDNNSVQGGNGGGICNNSGNPVSLANTIIADNRIPTHGEGKDISGTVESQGYNLIETITGAVITGDTTGNKTGVDPQLLPLDYYDQYKNVHAITETSPAVDAGYSFGYTDDQRGFERPFDLESILNANDGTDIGAYEYGLFKKSSITLSRRTFSFGVNAAAPAPQTNTFYIDHTGTSALSWTVGTDASWLSCSPTGGENKKMVTVTVNPQGLPMGTYLGTITVESPDAVNSPQQVTVVLRVYGGGAVSGPFGQFDSPSDQSLVSGSVAVTGWALDDTGVDRVEIYRSPMQSEGSERVFIGYAVQVEGARTDIEEKYPQFPNSGKAGWGYMMLTNTLPGGGNGILNLYAVAVDLEGNMTELGMKTIICDNANAVKPFGAIDWPGQGETISGSEYVNAGWVLTPPSNTVPIDGSTITVWIDGYPVYPDSNPAYNLYRKDIAELFPGYSNSQGAAGYLEINTTQYEDGVHTIAWSAEDDAGNIDGIGSRYFNIQNTGNRQQATGNSTGAPAWAPNHAGCMDEIPIDINTPITIEKGYQSNTDPELKYPDENGNTKIQIRPLERIKIQLNPNSNLTGYYIVNGEFRRLPIGSLLDSEQGVFYWQPGPGFVGTFRLVFIDKCGTADQYRRHITIEIR